MVFLFKILRRIITGILLLVVIVPPYAAGQIWWTAHHAQIKVSDAIVVLGAAQDNGVPTPILAERITQALLAYKAGMAPVIITVGGGQKGDISTEAAASRKSLISQNVPQSRVIAIPIGTDTLSSTIAYVSYMKLRNMKSVIV